MSLKKLVSDRLLRTKPARLSKDEFLRTWNDRFDTVHCTSFKGFSCPSCRGWQRVATRGRPTVCGTCKGAGEVPRAFAERTYLDEIKRQKTACAAWRRKQKRLQALLGKMTPADLKLISDLLCRPC